MSTSARVVAHSITPFGAEAVTMLVRFPRICLSEFNTHRKIAKNTSSSRAIPIERLVQSILNDMFIPYHWGKKRPGMQATEELDGWRRTAAETIWKGFGRAACYAALLLDKIGLHKQVTNRLIENFGYVNVVFTTTDLSNFFALRKHPDAQPEIQALAEAIYDAYVASTPELLEIGKWHLPFVTDEEKAKYSIDELLMLSSARCASTSYETVDKKPIDLEAASRIFEKLTKSNPIHASPFEHQLTPDSTVEIEYRVARSKKKHLTATVWRNQHLHGNTVGFIQHRKYIRNESVVSDNPKWITSF